jgi:exopolyphosphatase / guanosine-5'-triphosphate,3'-diphosphate pyrophosphatase
MSEVYNLDQRQLIIDAASKYSKDHQHSFSVEGISLKIFDLLSDSYNFSPGERNLLSHASLLHDIGNCISEKKHHEHTKYLIDNDELLASYPSNEKVLLSLIAYNHRKKIHSDVKLLSNKDRGLILRLSSILRVADSLDYSKENLVVNEVSIKKPQIKIKIDGELSEKLNTRLLRKKSLFCKIFNLDICFEK